MSFILAESIYKCSAYNDDDDANFFVILQTAVQKFWRCWNIWQKETVETDCLID